MGNKKVDMVEIHAFSDDLQQISLDMHSQLEKVIKSIDTIQGMSSFSGKAAKDAKRYFHELHVTVLIAFQGLFKDLEVNLRQHISTFESEVDDSESAIVTSHYLKEVREDIEETFEKLTSEDETIHDIISEVSDLTSATSPDFSDVNEWQKKAVKATKELEEDMSSFTSSGNETDVQAIMQQIERVMNKAKGSTGEAKFEGFEGVSSIKALRKLTDYNEEKENKRNKEIEEARDIRDRALKNADRSSKMVGDKAFIDYQGGKITKEAYIEIMTTLGKVQKELGEDELDEEVSETFLEYLWNNKVEFATDTTISSIIEYAGTHGSMKLGGMINTFRGIKGDGFVMVNPKSSQVAQPFLNPKTHKWAVNIGKWSGRVATPVGFGVGW